MNYLNASHTNTIRNEIHICAVQIESLELPGRYAKNHIAHMSRNKRERARAFLRGAAHPYSWDERRAEYVCNKCRVQLA